MKKINIINQFPQKECNKKWEFLGTYLVPVLVFLVFCTSPSVYHPSEELRHNLHSAHLSDHTSPPEGSSRGTKLGVAREGDKLPNNGNADQNK